jgi:hypothetical protein
MGDWLTLLVLVPAILVPVAVLIGFAGCDNLCGLIHVDPTKPIIDLARGKNGITITLVWNYSDVTVEQFRFVRTGPDGSSEEFLLPAPPVPFNDTVAPNPSDATTTTYKYHVRAEYSHSDPSAPSPIVEGTTLPFVPAYSRSLVDSTSPTDGGTLIQRIEASQLSATGPHVRITVQAAVESDASIDRVYISKASTTGNAWDSVDRNAIYDSDANQNQPFVVPAGTKRVLPIIEYTIDQSEALLIAIDFTPGPASNVPTGPTSRVGRAPGVLRSEATVYFLQPAAEAASLTRSPNYITVVDPMNTNTSYVMCVTNIEVDLSS